MSHLCYDLDLCSQFSWGHGSFKQTLQREYYYGLLLHALSVFQSHLNLYCSIWSCYHRFSKGIKKRFQKWPKSLDIIASAIVVIQHVTALQWLMRDIFPPFQSSGKQKLPLTRSQGHGWVKTPLTLTQRTTKLSGKTDIEVTKSESKNKENRQKLKTFLLLFLLHWRCFWTSKEYSREEMYMYYRNEIAS